MWHYCQRLIDSALRALIVYRSYLQCRDQVGCFQQGQLADLVHNGRNLGVRRRRGGIRLPSPLYPLLCSSNGRAGAHRRAGGADAAPQGARDGGGHAVLWISGGRWVGWLSLCRTFPMQCTFSVWRLGTRWQGSEPPLPKKFEKANLRKHHFNAITTPTAVYESVEIMGRRPEIETQHRYHETKR